MASFTFEEQQSAFADWQEASVTRPNQADRAAELVERGLARYKKVEALTGVPALWLGAVHFREASCNFEGVLHNGEHIIGTGQRTHLEPAGRGPFATWEAAAVDALSIEGLVNTGIDWADDQMWMFQWQRYNGEGYWEHGIPDPYVMAGTSVQKPGFYGHDSAWDPTGNDPRVGCWPILLACRKNAQYAVAPPVNGGLDVLSGIKRTIGAGTATGVLTLAGQIKDFATDWRTLSVLAVGGGLYIALQYLQNQNATAYREGRLIPKPEIGDFSNVDDPKPAV